MSKSRNMYNIAAVQLSDCSNEINGHTNYNIIGNYKTKFITRDYMLCYSVGPCALEYTRVKTHDHYWSDPPADELLQRHKLHSQ